MNIKKILGTGAMALILVAMALVTNPWIAEGGSPEIPSNDVGFSVVAVAETNTTVTWGYTTKRLSLYNSGSNTAYVDFIDGVATTANMPIYAGMSLNLDPFNSSQVGLICGAGESTTVTLYAPKFNVNWSP